MRALSNLPASAPAFDCGPLWRALGLPAAIQPMPWHVTRHTCDGGMTLTDFEVREVCAEPRQHPATRKPQRLVQYQVTELGRAATLHDGVRYAIRDLLERCGPMTRKAIIQALGPSSVARMLSTMLQDKQVSHALEAAT